MTSRLRRAIAIRALIVSTLVAIAAVRAGRALRHPAWHVRYLTARVTRRIPGRPDDGARLNHGEMVAFIAICRGWKHAARGERSPA